MPGPRASGSRSRRRPATASRCDRGLRFSDGSALDAQDVVGDVSQRRRPGAGHELRAHLRAHRARRGHRSPHAWSSTSTEPHATFLTDLELPILRAEDAHSAHRARSGQTPPVGAGPYVLAQREAGPHRAAANPHWHGGRAAASARAHAGRPRRQYARAAAARRRRRPRAERRSRRCSCRCSRRIRASSVQSVPGVGTTYIGLEPRRAGAARRARAPRARARDRSPGADRGQARRPRAARHELDRARPLGVRARRRPALRLSARARARAAARGRLSRRRGTARRSSSRCAAATIAFACRSRGRSPRCWREVGVEVEIRPSEMATLIADLNRGRFELTMLEVPEVIEPHVLQWFFGSDHIPGPGREGANRWRLREPGPRRRARARPRATSRATSASPPTTRCSGSSPRSSR